MTIRNLDLLLRPRRLLACGAPRTAAHAQILDNIDGSKPRQHCHAIGFVREGWRAADWHDSPSTDLAIVFDAETLAPAQLTALAERGCRALLWAADEPPSQQLLQAGRPQWVRLLGPRSGGVAWPGLGFNATACSQPLAKGRVALIAQSVSVAAAALDWAAGRELGFSWVAVTGGEADVDVGDLLDVAAVDPLTQAVVLQLSRVRGARKFMSAARACARNKPVLALQTPPAGGVRDVVRSAAMRRAGLIESEVLGGLFDGIAALERLPNLGRFRVSVVGNGAGVCALGLAAGARHGLQRAELSAPTLPAIREVFSGVRLLDGAIDVGSAPPPAIARILSLVLADTRIDAALLMHSPRAGQAHAETADEVAALKPGARLLTVWLGLHTALGARARSSERGVLTFASADEAMRALRFRQQHRQTQEILMQTPPPLDLPAVDRESLRTRLDAAAREHTRLAPTQAAELLRHYGLRVGGQAVQARLVVEIDVCWHEEFGQYLRVAGAGLWAGRGEGFGFAPLDLLLAGRLLEEAGLDAALRRRPWDPAPWTALLVRLGQMVIDQPAVATASLRFAPDGEGQPVLLAESELRLTRAPPPPRRRLALAAYPAELAHEVALKGGREFLVRVVRAEDEAAVIRLLERSDPENIRLRFFGYIRQFSHAMAARLTQLDYDREIAFVAMPRGSTHIVGLGHLMADPDAREAEFSLLVHQDYARIGLGRHLLSELVRHGRRQGIATVFGEILAENRPMQSLARALGFSIRHVPQDPGRLHAVIETAGFGDEAV